MNFEQALLLIGKLHPMVVHFPIAFLILAAALELINGLKGGRSPSNLGKVLVILGAAFAVIAAIFGWINASSQEFSGDLEELLFLHRWLGVSVAIIAVISAVLCYTLKRVSNSKIYFTYLFILILNAAVLSLGGHYGGLIVFGEEYFSEVFTESETALASLKSTSEAESVNSISKTALTSEPFSGPVNFLRDIRPILKRSCYRCHGGGQEKGKFRLDTRELFLAGGKSGAAVKVGDSAHSRLIDLVTATNPKKAMPNKGRRLSASEVEVLKAWIDQGLIWDTSEGANSIENQLELREVVLPNSKDGKEASPIDRLLSVYYSKHNFTPPPLISDRTFARRVYIDTIGRFPTVTELRNFESNTDANKRKELVARLLSDSHGYARHWLSFWNDHLRNDYTGTGFIGGGRKQLTLWLYQSLLKNKPYDKFVSELIAPNKRSDGFIKGIIWKGDVNPNERPEMQASQNIAQVFLGVNLKCASCHDSFTDSWTLEDAYGLANVFAKTPLSTHDCDKDTGEVAAARFIYPKLGKIPENLPIEERRSKLAELMLDQRDGAFSRTIVNRIWKRLFGFGLNEPVDQVDGAGWYPELHDWLARDFVTNGYDLKRLIEQILNSDAYQLPAVFNPEQVSTLTSAAFQFRGPLVRPVYAEEQIDSLRAIFSVTPDFGSTDFDRILKITDKAAGVVKYASRTFRPNGEREEINIDLSGLDQFWLIATNGRKAKDTEDKSKEDQAPKKVADSTCYVYSAVLETASGKSSLTKITPLEAIPAAAEVRTEGEEALVVHPFQALRFSVPGTSLKFLRGSFSAGGLPSDRAPKRGGGCQFYVLSDVNVDASMLEFTPLLEAFGRPLRDQVVTARESQVTSLRAMAFQNRDDISEYIARLSGLISTSFSKLSLPDKNGEMVNFVYESLAGRVPSPEEKRIADQALQGGSQGLEDLLWAVLLSPEVQYIL